MSFFDEADEPARTTSRTESRRRPTSGRGGPPRDPQAIQTRRVVAVVVLVVVVILLAVGIHSCQVSQTNDSLKNYNTNVYSLIQRSNRTGATVYSLLARGASASNEAQLQNSLVNATKTADGLLSEAQGLSVPSAMQTAQQNLVLTLQLRRDAFRTMAAEIEPAVGTTTRAYAVNQIAAANAQMYASDVIYKVYVLPEIVGALNAAGIAVGGANGQVLNGNQILNDRGWLDPSFVATELGTPVSGGASSTSHPFQPGLHGHSLNSVSVGGTQLSTASTATISHSPAPTFTLSLTNGGDFNEYNVKCTITIAGLNDSGTYTIPETYKGQNATCPVTLPNPPTPGTYQVTAEVVPVQGETNTSNNSMTFSITFS